MSIRSGVRILNSLRLCRYETLQFQSVISILVSLKLTICHALISLLPKRYCLPLGMCGYDVIYLVMLKCSMKMDNYMDIYMLSYVCVPYHWTSALCYVMNGNLTSFCWFSFSGRVLSLDRDVDGGIRGVLAYHCGDSWRNIFLCCPWWSVWLLMFWTRKMDSPGLPWRTISSCLEGYFQFGWQNT